MTRSPVVKPDLLPMTTQTHGEAFAARFAAIAAPQGATRLGARIVEVPPGKKAWPFHSHHANDELFLILSGQGVLRFGDKVYPVEAGDVAVCPAGGAETAHQLQALGDAPLRYVAVSSMHEPDVLEYPESGKLGVFAGAPPGGDKAERRIALFLPTKGAVDYWDGEG